MVGRDGNVLELCGDSVVLRRLRCEDATQILREELIDERVG
jgi:hypothetical protein